VRTINVKPVEIIGNCAADLTLDDEFQIEGKKLKNPRQSTLCLRAISHLPLLITLLQSGKHFYTHLTCPDCLSRLDQTICVVFLLGHADKWELCQAISEYNRLHRLAKEPALARELRLEAIRHQHLGEYLEAARKMEAALTELKRLPLFSPAPQANTQGDPSHTLPADGSDIESPQPGEPSGSPPTRHKSEPNGSD
jgi:hypothetical protein